MIEDVKVQEGWRRERLGEVIEIFDRERIPLDSEYRLTIKGSFPYCGATGVIDYINDYIFDGEYVLIAEDGGRFNRFEETAYIMKGKFWANNHVHILMGKRGVLNNLFLLYSINFQDISYYISGSTREKLNQQLLKSAYILFPSSLSEQRKIAEVLETVDNAIGRTDTIIEKYKRVKQGLMQDLLTRGVVENDELGVMSYELREEKKHRFNDSPLGRIPEEWEVVELMNGIGGNANLIVAGPFGSNLKVQDYKKTGIPIIRLQNIDENKFIDKDIKLISDKKAKELSYHSFKSGDLILAKLGDPIGKTCIVPNNFKYGIVVADVVRIRVNEQYADKRFISYILNFDICRNQLNTDIIGTTRPRVNLDQIRNAKIPLPPLSEQHIIASILSQTDETIEKEQKYKQKLERIKQGLMEDLLTGKVRVNHLIKQGMKNVQPA